LSVGNHDLQNYPNDVLFSSTFLSILTLIDFQDPWKELSKAFANERDLFQLLSRLQWSLAETLCHSAWGMGGSDATNQYVRDLMGPVPTYLINLLRNGDLNSYARKPDVIFLVTRLVERLKGATMATKPRSQKAIFEMSASVTNSLLRFLEVYKNQSMVVYVLLKFTVDWVDGQVAF